MRAVVIGAPPGSRLVVPWRKRLAGSLDLALPWLGLWVRLVVAVEFVLCGRLRVVIPSKQEFWWEGQESFDMVNVPIEVEDPRS